ncbi:hypothetical protein [Dyadobacter pollutisoli]|jgi:hypothetical protein|uniref:Uncharacterized protein n=1 Tax=Dyadobacter pollutisoli TaxID=2910158 RepID=A0A9E8NC91_9BACT|nr:hypothetical protein [Dyadobacter pollutisoli]WAC11891.1 hypothetical protein ON006_29690 [Dyadobacter pollutisoli]
MKKLWRLRQKIDAAHRFFDSGELPRPDGAFLLPSSTTNKGDLMMTDQNETTTKYPTHTVYFVKQNESTGKSEWIKAGVAWEHQDNEGMNLSLDSLGQRVSLTVRKNTQR